MILEAGKIYQVYQKSGHPFLCLKIDSVYSGEIYSLWKDNIFFVVRMKEETNSPNYISFKILTNDGTICWLEVNKMWGKESIWHFEEVK